VQTVHLANGAVTAPKIANGTVVRSLNGLFDNVAIVGGTNITVTPSGNTLTIAAPSTLTAVSHDATLTGNGTSTTPLGIANGGVGTTQLANQSVTTAKLADSSVTAAQLAPGSVNAAQLADGSITTAKLADSAVTLSKIAVNQVVTSLNGMKEGVTLAAGSNISITPSGNSLTFSAAESAGPAAYHAVGTPTDEFTNPGYDVISKELPAGSYFLFYKMGYYSLDGDSQEFTCTMSTGSHSSIRVQEHATGHFVLQTVASFAVPTTVTVHCTGFRILPYEQVYLTAIRVGSIQ
jgi:hypothetical protein